MSTTEEEVGITSPYGGNEASDERELANDEGVSARSAVPISQFVPDLNMVVMEGEGWVKRALEEVGASIGRAEEASEGDSFVDIMGSLEKQTGSESDGFTFPGILQRADFLSETVLESLVDTADLPLC